MYGVGVSLRCWGCKLELLCTSISSSASLPRPLYIQRERCACNDWVHSAQVPQSPRRLGDLEHRPLPTIFSVGARPLTRSGLRRLASRQPILDSILGHRRLPAARRRLVASRINRIRHSKVSGRRRVLFLLTIYVCQLSSLILAHLAIFLFRLVRFPLKLS